MAVSRNLAINFVCSKLEPFIRGHDLPAQDCQIVNDDDDADSADDDVVVDNKVESVLADVEMIGFGLINSDPGL